ARVEQELVRRVPAERQRRQRVVERRGAKELERPRDDLPRRRIVGEPPVRERADPWIAVRRERRERAALALVERLEGAVVDVGRDAIVEPSARAFTPESP